MLDASNAIENQKVSICRLSSENRAVIIKALDIAWGQALNKANDPNYKGMIELANVLQDLEVLIKGSSEIWLITNSK